MTHFTRSQWGARTPRKGNVNTPGVKGVAFHYNGPAMGIDPNKPCQCAAKVRATQNFHMDSRGWADIAYDVIACPHGNTFQGRLGTGNGTGANGSNSANQNYKAVMALIGGNEPLGDKLKTAMLMGRSLCRAAGAGSAITPHSQHENTACPGPNITAWIKKGAPAPSSTAPTPNQPPKEATVLSTFLERGSEGPEVTLLQQMLNGMDKAGLSVDGSFGPALETAVKNAQEKRSLSVDGKVGPATRTRLNADWKTHNAPKPTPAPTPTPTPTPVPSKFTPEQEQWRQLATGTALFKDRTAEDPETAPRIPLGRMIENLTDEVLAVKQMLETIKRMLEENK